MESAIDLTYGPGLVKCPVVESDPGYYEWLEEQDAIFFAEMDRVDQEQRMADAEDFMAYQRQVAMGW